MNSKLRNKIININSDFYKKEAEDFSNSRQYPWKGWLNVIPAINAKDKKNFSVLDLACGNGRLLEFLLNHMTSHTFEYLGVDNNKFLLTEAKNEFEYKNIEFKNLNIFEPGNFPSQKFDLVCGFGITHHIPGYEFRNDWFESLTKLVCASGLLILSFWHPNPDKLLKEKMEGFESGDFFMGWDKSSAKRYVHIYTESEFKCLIELMSTAGLKLINRYKSDIKEASWNEYLVFKNAS